MRETFVRPGLAEASYTDEAFSWFAGGLGVVLLAAAAITFAVERFGRPD